MSKLPSPLVAGDVDLRDFPFMPLDVARLRDSGIATRASGDAFRAAVLLWCASWHQVPCASLPDDDYEFAKLAGYGRDLRGWKKVREDALRGWLRCDDGRFYHPVVAEKALEGWIEKLVQGKSSDAGNAKLYGYAFDPAAHDAAIEASKAQLFALNPRSRILKKKGKRYAPGNPNGAKTAPESRPVGTPGRSPDGSPDQIPTGSQETRKGQGQGQGHLKERSSLRSDAAPAALDRERDFDRFWQVYPKRTEVADARRALDEALDAGAPIDDIVAGAKRFVPTVAGREDRFVMSPVRWLRGERWKDGLKSNGPDGAPSAIFISNDDPRFSRLAERYNAENGRQPKDIGTGGRAFPAAWVADLEPEDVS